MTPLRQFVSAALFGAITLFSSFCAVAAHADEEPDASLKSPSWLAPRSSSPKAARPVAGGPSLGLGRSVGVLVLVGVLGGAALYLRSKKNKAPKVRLAQLRVLGSTKLGGRASLVLAEVAGRKILLGVTDGSVRKLGWLDPEAEEDELFTAPPRLVATGLEPAQRTARSYGTPARAYAEPAVAAPAPKRSFRDLLASAVGNIGRPDDSAAETLATETQDTFTRSAPRAGEARRAEPARKAANPHMVDVEGQAKGLLARLGDPRP